MKINSLTLFGTLCAVIGGGHILAAVSLYIITASVRQGDMAMPPFQLIATVRFWYLAGGLIALLGGILLAYIGRRK